ncbi:MAG TPA: hypothetical protein VK959_03100 [Methylophilaceae bacterium]|jgi:hypothetical protein|nr:hypothetical protein [Methylophilaceae bacterium]
MQKPAPTMRDLTKYFAVSYLSLILAIATIEVSEKLALALVCIGVISGLLYYVTLATMATNLKRNPIYWVGGSIIFAPLGPILAYLNMWRLSSKSN